MSIGIGKFIYESDIVNSVNSIYMTPEHFINSYKSTISELEQKLLLRHIIRFNVPFIFKDRPLIFEQIRSYLSHLLDIEVGDILIIGSSKTGFSMSPKEYGKAFSEQSDIDFTIVNHKLFEQLKREFLIWKLQYTEENILKPQNDTEKFYWNENLKVIKRTIDRGFIDCRKLPTRKCCPLICKIINGMSLITKKLHKDFNIIVKHSSVRVYIDIPSFYSQFKINTDYLIKL